MLTWLIVLAAVTGFCIGMWFAILSEKERYWTPKRMEKWYKNNPDNPTPPWEY